MKLNIKKYKLKKIKNYIKNNKLIFFMSTVNLKTTKKENFKHFFVKNTFFKKVLKQSIYTNLNFIVNGITNLSTIKHKHQLHSNIFFNLKKSLNSKNANILIALKLNNKIYSPVQITKIKSLNYSQNIGFLHNTLKNYTFFPSKNFISK